MAQYFLKAIHFISCAQNSLKMLLEALLVFVIDAKSCLYCHRPDFEEMCLCFEANCDCVSANAISFPSLDFLCKQANNKPK